MKTNNPNGRPAGTPNKLTAELRAILKNIIAKELETLLERLEKLPDQERILLLIKILPFILPKVEPVLPSAGEPLQFDW